MKNLILKVAILVMIIGVANQNTFAKTTVPAAVKTAFTTKYAQAHLKKWETNKDTSIAVFVSNNRTYQAYYTSDGNWVSTKRDIKHETSLPSASQSFLKNGKYASWHIDRMQKIQMPAQTMYRVHIDNHSGNPSEYEGAGSASDKVLYFDNNGKLIKVE